MSEHKQIERVFQEAFNGFEAKPSQQVWKSLQSELKQKEKKKSFLFWALSVSAILLLGFISYTSLSTAKNIQIEKTTKNNTNSKGYSTAYDNQKIAFNIIPDNLYFSNNKQKVKIENQEAFIFKLNKGLFNLKLQKEFLASNYSASNKNKTPNTAKSNAVEQELYENSSALAENTIAINTKKWEFTPFSSTTYFSSLGQGSPLDESLKDNKKEFETSQSFGFNIGKRIANRWKLSTGLSLLKLNYSTFNIAYKNDYSTSRFSGVSYNQYNNYTSVRDLDNTTVAWNEHEGRIQQEIEYLEVPFSVSYTIKDSKRLDFGITGGVSTLFLTNNQLSLHDINSGKETYFGKANNLSMINASANASLDFNYHISRTIHLNVSPSFKYYMEMFEENSGNFKPYSVGISTGLKVKF